MKENAKKIIEAILFSAGRSVSIKEITVALEISPNEIIELIEELKNEYESQNRGMEIIKINDSYQMCTKKELYEYIAPIFDKKSKPNLSNANITRAEIETIRGVNCDGTIYKLLEYNLIEESGKLDAPGRPTTYVTTEKFLKMFGLTSLEELPELPKYKLDQNQQIVIDEE